MKRNEVMTNYKLTYNEGDTINKTCVIEASSMSIAIVNFWLTYPEATDLIKAEIYHDEDED